MVKAVRAQRGRTRRSYEEDAVREEELAYYSTPGPMTTLDTHPDAFHGLPTDPSALGPVVQGLILHEFWAEKGTGTSLVGEVSSVNDDTADNLFFERLGRFPTIDEDVSATHKLCTEY